MTRKLRSGEWVRVNVRLEEEEREQTEHFRQEANHGLKVLNPERCWTFEA